MFVTVEHTKSPKLCFNTGGLLVSQIPNVNVSVSQLEAPVDSLYRPNVNPVIVFPMSELPACICSPITNQAPTLPSKCATSLTFEFPSVTGMLFTVQPFPVISSHTL